MSRESSGRRTVNRWVALNRQDLAEFSRALQSHGRIGAHQHLHVLRQRHQARLGLRIVRLRGDLGLASGKNGTARALATLLHTLLALGAAQFDRKLLALAARLLGVNAFFELARRAIVACR